MRAPERLPKIKGKVVLMKRRISLLALPTLVLLSSAGDLSGVHAGPQEQIEIHVNETVGPVTSYQVFA
jgi:hypothetical protein